MKVISFINMKGGVGKTTTAVGVAEALAIKYKVLFIDLDPQTNATGILIEDEKWEEINNKGQTMYHMFKSMTDSSYKSFDIEVAIQKNVGNLRDIKTLDLLCSSTDMIYDQDSIISSMPIDRCQLRHEYLKTHIECLRSKLDDEYDFIVIDYPPSLNLITQNGLAITDYYIIPTIPDRLSTKGIRRIIEKINEFSIDIDKEIIPLGIVITKMRSNNDIKEVIDKYLVNEESNLRKVECNYKGIKRCIETILFKSEFKECTDIAKAGEYAKLKEVRYNLVKKSFKEQWGAVSKASIGESFENLANEIIAKINESNSKDIHSKIDIN